MRKRTPLVLLDDARGSGARDAQLFEGPAEVFVARRPSEVSQVLAAADEARRRHGGTLAGYIAYEAGFALEPRLAKLAEARTGAGGPLVWLGRFEEVRMLPPSGVAEFLADRSDGAASIGPLVPQVSRGAYDDMFGAVQDAIAAGDIYQANLTFPLAGGFTGDPLALYATLRPAGRAGYGAAVFDGDRWLLSQSPELFVSLDGRDALVKPMKGTRPRALDDEEDRALREELANSEKDRAENLMILDLLRNDLARVAEAGSVTVEDAFAVESFPTVHQMTSTVRARLAETSGALDLVTALFPCGSVTGAPKIRAMEILAEIERDARGPYCGAIGKIGPDGDVLFNVAIRTLRLTEIENGRGKAEMGVGGAIVAGSDAGTEWREALVKGAFVRVSDPLRQAPAVDLLETMRFEPETGIPDLEAHMHRMRDSATALGVSFDRHEARNRIHALCFDLDFPACIRLMCSRGGALALEVRPLPEAWAAPAAAILLPLPVDPGDWRLTHKTSDRG
ncbi:aminodeoxychorismate synthase component I, partial [Qipengyuania sp.]|uniref:aminodeoxychorismate synthase component I n=1 Tax=Qipengyuania sp. TaxID=2004515 RepID=UPI0035C7F226